MVAGVEHDDVFIALQLARGSLAKSNMNMSMSEEEIEVWKKLEQLGIVF